MRSSFHGIVGLPFKILVDLNQFPSILQLVADIRGTKTGSNVNRLLFFKVRKIDQLMIGVASVSRGRRGDALIFFRRSPLSDTRNDHELGLRKVTPYPHIVVARVW